MTATPPPPLRRCEPEQVADDTYVIRQLAGEGQAPVAVYVNSMVITGAEPVIVDCGPTVNGAAWREDVFSIVDPADVRWIYLSHDDPDHTGNLLHCLEVCPDATLVTNWFTVERLATEYALPMTRMRWVNDGDSFHAGDRALHAVLPPTFDSPTTRGLYDSTSGVYWASDSFGCPVPFEARNIEELDPGFFREGFLHMQQILSPWHRFLDPTKFGAHLDRVRALAPTVVASAHGPALHGTQVGSGLELMAELPYLPAAQVPDQGALEAIVAQITAPPAVAADELPVPGLVEPAAEVAA